MTETIDYVRFLEERAQREGPKRKGERTRDRLKIATIELLNQCSFQDLRVTDICDRTKIAPGTFYLYYENKQLLTIEILSEYVELWTELSKDAASAFDNGDDLFEAIYQTNLSYLNIARANPGLTRCVMQMSEIEPEFATFVHSTSSEIYSRTVAAIAKRTSADASPDLLLTINALGSMMDDLVRRLCVVKDPYLTRCVDEAGFDTQGIARHLTTLWYRAIFGENPPKSTN